MRSNDFYDFGEQIQKIVQSAIDSNDFQELNKAVRETVNDAAEVFRSGVSEVSGEVNRAKRQYSQKVTREEDTVQRNVKNEVSYKKREVMEKKLFVAHPRGEFSGVFMEIVGFLFATITGIAAVILGIMLVLLDGLVDILVLEIIFILLFALLLFVGIRGRIMSNRAKRFRKYQEVLDDREYCDIAELASKTDKSPAFILKDVKDMIKRKMFLQGHVDQQGTCLIVTDAMYEQYRTARQSMEERQARENEEAKKMASPKYTDEVRQMLIEGKRYVEYIRECNDDIPGVDMTIKISHLELIVSKIFAQVEKDPTLAPELHQFMSYYLPTTEKLLTVYRELDKQPVQGDNIRETKKEIEATLDTLNQAFEKILDSCYKDMAWDVTTDISVLNTMLAKEGLTEDEMQLHRRAK